VSRSGRPATSQLEPNELRGVAILQGVALESVWGILSHCPVYEVDAERVVISPDDLERTLYIVLHGTLRVYLEPPGARTSSPPFAGQPTGLLSASVAELMPGETVGELSVLQARPATAHVVTATPARLLAISEAIFWRLVQASHEFAINLLVQLAQRMGEHSRQLSESVAQRRMLEREVTTDALTGLFNRRWLDQRLSRFVERHRRNGTSLSVLMLDVDHFKRVNDEYGHAAGDAVLVQVARTLLACLRPTDMSARYGGEELAVILPDTDLGGAMVAAERLRKAIAALVPEHDPTRKITVSIGVATFTQEDTAQTLLARADGLLYRAKDRGRNSVAS
jgi:diguanylate cyclase (GGDEF)-like protein